MLSWLWKLTLVIGNHYWQIKFSIAEVSAGRRWFIATIRHNATPVTLCFVAQIVTRCTSGCSPTKVCRRVVCVPCRVCDPLTETALFVFINTRKQRLLCKTLLIYSAIIPTLFRVPLEERRTAQSHISFALAALELNWISSRSMTLIRDIKIVAQCNK